MIPQCLANMEQGLADKATLVGLGFGDDGTEMRHLSLGTFVAAARTESPMPGYGTWETVVMRCIPGGRAACSCYIFFEKNELRCGDSGQ
jgi:hypothetical protein